MTLTDKNKVTAKSRNTVVIIAGVIGLILLWWFYPQIRAAMDPVREVSSVKDSVIPAAETSDAAAIVPAMRAFSASECRKNMPAQIRLMSEHFNGDDDATHTVIYGFASPQDMQTSYQVQGSCPEFASLWSVISKHTTPTAQSLGMNIVGGGDPTKDSVYQIWQMKITDEKKYVKAYTKLMSDMEKAGLVRGAWGLVRFAGI